MSHRCFICTTKPKDFYCRCCEKNYCNGCEKHEDHLAEHAKMRNGYSVEQKQKKLGEEFMGVHVEILPKSKGRSVMLLPGPLTYPLPDNMYSNKVGTGKDLYNSITPKPEGAADGVYYIILYDDMFDVYTHFTRRHLEELFNCFGKQFHSTNETK